MTAKKKRNRKKKEKKKKGGEGHNLVKILSISPSLVRKRGEKSSWKREREKEEKGGGKGAPDANVSRSIFVSHGKGGGEKKKNWEKKRKEKKRGDRIFFRS